MGLGLCSGVLLLTSLEARGWLTLAKSCLGEVECNRGCLFEGGLALLGPSSLSLISKGLDLLEGGDCLGDAELVVL